MPNYLPKHKNEFFQLSISIAHENQKEPWLTFYRMRTSWTDLETLASFAPICPRVILLIIRKVSLSRKVLGPPKQSANKWLSKWNGLTCYTPKLLARLANLDSNV